MSRVSPNRPLTWSIKRKVLLTIAAALVLMIGASHLFNYLHWRSQLYSLAESQGVSMMVVATDGISRQCPADSFRSVHHMIDHLGEQVTVQSLRILDRQGNVRISFDPTEVGRMRVDLPSTMEDSPATSAILQGQTRVDGVTNLFQTVPFRTECFRCHKTEESQKAILQLGLDTTALDEFLRGSSYQVLALAGSTALLLLGALFFLFRREIDRPVSEVLQAMRAAKAGHLGVRVPIRRRDEFGVIGGELNRMLEELSKARERERTHHEMEMSQQERLATIGNLASAVAHEIKSPLAGIRSAMDVFDQEIGEEDSKRELLSEVLKEIERINQMVRDLLEYSRAPEPETLPTCLSLLVESVLSQISSLSGGKDIEIRRSDLAGDHLVAVDYQLMKRALLNIIQNAFDAMPQGGKLELRAWTEEGRGLIAVRDSGGGLDPKYLARIMQPFFTTRHRGTGLGLPIALSIVEAHQGNMTFENHFGDGMQFTISLPLLEPENGARS